MISLADLGFLNGRMGKGLFLLFTSYFDFVESGERISMHHRCVMSQEIHDIFTVFDFIIMDYYTIVIWLHECSQEQEYPLT